MKKSLLAFAVLSTFAAVASAQTSVTLYGVADVAPTFYSSAGTTGAHRSNLDNGVMSGSRWGIKGTEDLGGGLAARFNVESSIGLDTGTAGSGGTLFDRTATVGFVSSTYGTVDLGRQTSVEYDAFSVVDPASYFFGGNNPNRAFGVLTSAATVGATVYGTTGTDRQNNSVKYTTPTTIDGVKASFQHGAGEQAGNDGTSSYDGVSASFSNGGFVGVVALSKLKNTLNQNQTLTDAGVKYTIDAVTLKATVARNNTTVGKRRIEVGGVGLDYVFTPVITFSGAFYQTRQSDITNPASSKSNQYIGIAKYSLSKRTTAYTTLTYATTANTAASRALSLGLVGPGDTHGIRTSVGVNHTF